MAKWRGARQTTNPHHHRSTQTTQHPPLHRPYSTDVSQFVPQFQIPPIQTQIRPVPRRCTNISPYTFWPRIDGSGQLLNRNKTKGIRDNTVTATTAKNRVIDTIGGASAGYYFRPELFAASPSGEQHPPTPPRPTTGHRGSFCFDRAGSDPRRIDRSWRMIQSPQHEPDNSARVGEGRSVGRRRALRQSHLVAWERLRRELGSKPVSVTTAVTRGEGQHHRR